MVRHFLTHVIRLCLALALGFGLCSAAAAFQAEPATESAAAAYRADDFELARTLWLEALTAEGSHASDAERARLCYNLGKVASRREDTLLAVAWYTAALRLRPRDEDTWANLELERLKAGLEAADRGDLAATVERLLTSWTGPEASILALLGLLPLAVTLGFEALRGSRRWRWFALLALSFAVVSALPYARHRLEASRDSVMVVSKERVPVRSEPRSDAERVGELAPGTIVDRLDSLPEWTEVEFEGHRQAWLRTAAVFELNR